MRNLVTFGGDAEKHLAGEVLAFVPEDTGNRIHWNCHTEATTLQNRYRPFGVPRVGGRGEMKRWRGSRTGCRCG